MHNKSYLIWGYAALLLIGGIIGFVKAGSIASLVISACFALLLTGTGYQVFKGNMVGYNASISVLIGLFTFFVSRFIGSYKMMPGGMMAIVTLCLFSFLLWKKPVDSEIKNPVKN